MTIHTQIAEPTASQLSMPSGDVILPYSKFSLLLHGNWTTYWCLLHHSSSVCNIYIINQEISTSCTHKLLTCTPFSSSFWCLWMYFANCTFLKRHLTPSNRKCKITLLACSDLLQVHLNTF